MTTKDEMREEIEQYGKMYKEFLHFLEIYGKDATKGDIDEYFKNKEKNYDRRTFRHRTR